MRQSRQVSGLEFLNGTDGDGNEADAVPEKLKLNLLEELLFPCSSASLDSPLLSCDGESAFFHDSLPNPGHDPEPKTCVNADDVTGMMGTDGSGSPLAQVCPVSSLLNSADPLLVHDRI